MISSMFQRSSKQIHSRLKSSQMRKIHFEHIGCSAIPYQMGQKLWNMTFFVEKIEKSSQGNLIRLHVITVTRGENEKCVILSIDFFSLPLAPSFQNKQRWMLWSVDDTKNSTEKKYRKIERRQYNSKIIMAQIYWMMAHVMDSGKKLTWKRDAQTSSKTAIFTMMSSFVDGMWPACTAYLNNVSSKPIHNLLSFLSLPLFFYLFRWVNTTNVNNFLSHIKYKVELAYLEKFRIHSEWIWDVGCIAIEIVNKLEIHWFRANNVLFFWYPQMCWSQKIEIKPTQTRYKYTINLKVILVFGCLV